MADPRCGPGVVVAYRLDIDLIAAEQIRALPAKALAALS